MPGIVVAAGPHAADALAAMARAGWQRQTFTARTAQQGLIAGASAYPSYPIASASASGCTAVLEGAVYGRSSASVADMLAGLATSFASEPEAARKAAEAWALGTDGDFVILVCSGRGDRALVVNDRLGRLPLFVAASGGSAAIARELKCVRAACGAGDVDRRALAQTLLFTFPLGSRTLHEHIARLPEASSSTIDAAGNVDTRRYYRWDFEQLESGGTAPDAKALAELFVDRTAAIGAWRGTRPVVLGLSGGLDSRAVAAALGRADIPCSALTFTSRRKKAAEETETSAQIARALGIPWEALVLAPPSWQDERAMAIARDGTSNVALSFLAQYFEVVQQRFGAEVLHLTGDGGDRALPDLRAEIGIADRARFLEFRLANGLWSVDEAAALAGLRGDDVVESVRSHFETYPERGPSLNVRFMIADWAFNRLFMGEDRNRSFVWNATPFYCQSFFEAAMRVPLAAKRHYGLYARVLDALDPRLRGIAKSNWGHAVDSPFVRLAAWRDSIGSAFAFAAKRRLRPRSDGAHGEYGTEAHNPEFAALARRYRGPGFDLARLGRCADLGLGKLQFNMLSTVLLYVDSIWGETEGHADDRPV